MKLLSLIFFFFCTCLNAQLVFEEPPSNFNPKVEVAACFMNEGEKVLFLKRLPHKSEGNTWGIPGGKLEKNENAQQAVVREVKEETGIDLNQASLKYCGKVYIRYPKGDFIYHMFETELFETREKIVINPLEHSDFRWLTLQEALKLPLIPGEDECIQLVYGVNP